MNNSSVSPPLLLPPALFSSLSVSIPLSVHYITKVKSFKRIWEKEHFGGDVHLSQPAQSWRSSSSPHSDWLCEEDWCPCKARKFPHWFSDQKIHCFRRKCIYCLLPAWFKKCDALGFSQKSSLRVHNLFVKKQMFLSSCSMTVSDMRHVFSASLNWPIVSVTRVWRHVNIIIKRWSIKKCLHWLYTFLL